METQAEIEQIRINGIYKLTNENKLWFLWCQIKLTNGKFKHENPPKWQKFCKYDFEKNVEMAHLQLISDKLFDKTGTDYVKYFITINKKVILSIVNKSTIFDFLGKFRNWCKIVIFK
jgi:hypothetical protein